MSSRPTLLCVANFPSGTGYAWDFFEGLFADVAERFASREIRTVVAYPEILEPLEGLEGSPAEPVEFEVRLSTLGGLAQVVRFIRKWNVQAILFIDRGFWSPTYPILRAAGVHRIVAYDESSGTRTPPSGVKQLLKSASRKIPGTLADRVLTVSHFVARRQVKVGLIPKDRVKTVWNGVPIPPLPAEHESHRLREELGVGTEDFLVACTCRASESKGIQYLFRAFDRFVCELELEGAPSTPTLIFVGDGPYLDELRQLRINLRAGDRIIMTGYRDDAADIVGVANVAVVPSVWEEAFGIAALEPMTQATPVVASSVGGIPEIVQHEETGLLVPPGDEAALASALRYLFNHPGEADRMGDTGRNRARRQFDPEQQIRQLFAVLEGAFGDSGATTTTGR